MTATRIETGDLGAGDADAQELTARINEELSRRIRAMPEAWVWMHERWGLGCRGGERADVAGVVVVLPDLVYLVLALTCRCAASMSPRYWRQPENEL